MEILSIVKREQEIIKKEPGGNITYENMRIKIKDQTHGIISMMDTSKKWFKDLERGSEEIFQKEARDGKHYFV